MENYYLGNHGTRGTRRNKKTHVNRYLEFCEFSSTRPFPVNEFKICKYATFLAVKVKTVEAIKSYCGTICEENELRGHRPVRRGIKYYRAISGIRNSKRHKVKRAQPMTPELLTRIQEVVNLAKSKEMVTWVAMLGGFHLVLRKSNYVPLSQVHDTVHNICRRDIRYVNGVMVVVIKWSKTDQLGQNIRKEPMIANSHSPICPVKWILYMIDRIPALPKHNLFSYFHEKKQCLVPITYMDLMTQMRTWLKVIGVQNYKEYSSHSLRRGSATLAFKRNLNDTEIMRLGSWKSQCFRNYIEPDTESKIVTWKKFSQN